MSGERPSLAHLEALGPARAAALWLERLARDDVGNDDALFRQWLELNNTNRLAWDRARDLWDTFEADEDDVLGSMRQEALSFPPRRLVSPWIGYAVAASVAILVAITVLLGVDRGGPSSAPQIASNAGPDLRKFGHADYATQVGQRSTVTLSDGTRLTLDTDSAVDVAYADGLRLVRLVRGQAFFDVAHDAVHPFRVAAGGRVVTALGTRFNVRLLAEETRILLVEGSVGVSRGEDPGQTPTGEVRRLTPGQQLIARPNRPDQVTRADGGHVADWQSGFLQFDGAPLSQAVAELNRYTRDQLIIRDPKVASMRVSGAFRTGDIKGFASTLSELYPVRVVPAGDGKLEIAPRR